MVTSKILRSAKAGASRLATWTRGRWAAAQPRLECYLWSWWRGSPPLQSAVFFGTAGLVYLALTLSSGSSTLAESSQYEVWKVVLALAITCALTSGIEGIRSIRNLVIAQVADGKWWRTWAYVMASAGAVGLIFWFLLGTQPGTGRTWPIEDMQVLLGVVAVGFGVTAIPWLTLVWLAHKTAREWTDPVPITALRDLYEQLTRCALAFAALVVYAMVPTAVLRAVWFSQPNKPDDSWPSTDVLLYGGFFAVVLLAITTPLIVVWRAKARLVVDAACPIDRVEKVTGDLIDKRDRLERLLHLDVGILRSPLTALSIFTPLVTALLGAYLPELGQ